MQFELAIAALVSLAISLLACRAIISHGPIDRPDAQRKSHPAPTPTSGGLAIGVGFAAGVLTLALFAQGWSGAISDTGVRRLWVTALVAYPLLIIGFIDDAIHLRVRVKFLLYGLISLLGAHTFGVVQTMPLTAEVSLHLPYIAGLAGTALWIFTLVNCVNFMDGANGLAMGSVAIGLCALGVAGLGADIHSAAAIGACGAGALVGFLIWNFPFGRLFAGDSGALFAAALGAFMALILIARFRLSPFAAPIVFFPLLADALITLFWRLRLRGWRALFVGHEEHHYQLLRRGGVNSVAITLLYWAMTAGCGALTLWLAQNRDPGSSLAALVGLAALATMLSLAVRGWARRRGLV
jgi:UDP-N-acetylmuramyl pentapeptide phosphotransferase/UDP-N-acetylglucosamine-1-phosphate transferase